MTSLLSARRRAEEFAAAVDAAVDHRSASPALAELVDLVGALRSQQPPAPRPEFTSSLRDRLMAEADRTLVQDAALTLPRRRTGARERRLAIAASSFVLVGGSAGLAAAAQSSLPGDALYPIKRGIESAHTGLSTNDVDKGRDLLGQADSRLSEVRGLLDENSGAVDSTQVPATIHDFAQQAQQGSQLLLDSYAQNPDSGVVVEVRRFAADGLTTLQDLAKHAPAQEQTELTKAALVLQQIDRNAAQACSSCASDLPALQLPPVFLTSAEVDRALDAVHRAHLNNDHPPMGTTLPVGPHDGTKGGGAGKGSTGGTGTGDGSTDGTGGSTGSTGDGQPSLPGLPTGGSGAGDLPKKITKVPGKVGSKTGDATKKVLPDPVDQVLKTLLP